jgi:hypothetical protein
LFYRSTEESLLLRGAEGKTKNPKGLIRLFWSHPRGITRVASNPLLEANGRFFIWSHPRGITRVASNPSFSAEWECNLQQNPEIASVSGFSFLSLSSLKQKKAKLTGARVIHSVYLSFNNKVHRISVMLCCAAFCVVYIRLAYCKFVLILMTYGKKYI